MLGCLVSSVGVFSQEEHKKPLPSRETTTEERVRKTAGESQLQAALAPEVLVTFAQILADPDNIDLNFRYAQTQVAQGDLLGASATLERVLLIKPELPQIRLYYGLVLLRLNNLEEAERELRAVSAYDMPPPLRQEVDSYLRAIRLSRKRTRLSSSFALGFQFDTNRNAAPSSKQRLSSDIPLGLTGTNRKRRDTSLLVIHTLDLMHDLGFQAGHQLLGSFTYYLGEQTVVDDLDLQSFSLEAGGLIKTPWADLTPKGVVTHTALSRETYLRTQGVTLSCERKLTPRWEMTLEGGWAREDFSGISEYEAALERTGGRSTVNFGTSYLVMPTMKLGSEIGYENKTAKADYQAYDALELEGTHTWILPKGQFFLNTLTYEFDDYDRPDFAISGKTRRDHQLCVRVLYGLPVFLLLQRVLPEPVLRDTTATFSFEQLRSLSSITNYTYSNSKFTFMMIKKTEF